MDILAGTDAANPFVLPGYSIHTELELLVDAGLSVGDALRSATVLPAKYLRAANRIGRIAPGFEADLVLLAANPLEDIARSRSIEHVVVNGQAYTVADLRQRLRDAVPDD